MFPKPILGFENSLKRNRKTEDKISKHACYQMGPRKIGKKKRKMKKKKQIERDGNGEPHMRCAEWFMASGRILVYKVVVVIIIN